MIKFSDSFTHLGKFPYHLFYSQAYFLGFLIAALSPQLIFPFYFMILKEKKNVSYDNNTNKTICKLFYKSVLLLLLGTNGSESLYVGMPWK